MVLLLFLEPKDVCYCLKVTLLEFVAKAAVPGLSNCLWEGIWFLEFRRFYWR